MRYRAWFSVWVAVFTFFLLVFESACHTETAAPVSVTGIMHDTPIIIQGGSLMVWSKQKLDKNASKRLVTSVPSPVTLIRQFKDGTLTGGTTYTIPGTLSTSWALCADDPYFQRIDPIPNLQIEIDSWGKNVGIDVFATDRPEPYYPYKQKHTESTSLQRLYFGSGACEEITKGSEGKCSTDLGNAPCSIDCPNGKCWIGVGS